MNASTTVPDSFGAQPAAPLTPTHPYYWALRREFWEYRSIYIAPLAAAAVTLFGFLFVLPHLPGTLAASAALDPAHRRDAVSQPYDLAAGLVMGAAFLVSIFYSLDALYGERRDRSILFWKSLPVSDLTTVLAKATVPLLILPILAFAIMVVTTGIMLIESIVVVSASGQSVATLWSLLESPTVLFGLLYHIVTIHMLWYAPIYAWMLLLSAWARRAPFLWAVLPALALIFFEKIAFHTSYFLNFLQERIGGGDDTMNAMQTDFPVHPGMHFTPLKFLAMPGLWAGLIAAAVFLFAAARIRRYRMPN